MGKLKIAYLIDTISCDTAGTQKQLLEIVSRLDKDRFEPFVICLWESPWMKQHELPCQSFVLEFAGFLKPNILRVVRRLDCLIRDLRIDLLQTFFVESLFIAYLAIVFGDSKVVMISSRRDMGLGSEPWYHRCFDLLLPIVNRRFDGIVANGTNVMQYVKAKEKVPLHKIRVIRNGVSVPERLDPEPDIFSFNKADFWIGVTASLTPVKRIDVFLRAIARLKLIQEGIDFRAVVIGAGPERERLQAEAEALGVGHLVYFVGEVHNVNAYLQRLNIGVLCSDREGFSNSVLEYMACALPVVATSVGGNTELVDDTNGICVPSGDPDALAEAMRRLAVDRSLRDDMGKRSLEKIRNSHSWERSITEWKTYYEEMIGAHPC